MPKPKALDIFIVAEQFRLVSRLPTMVTQHPMFRIPALADQNLTIASMVCSAFSLELYFKCLIRMGRKSFGRQHDLAKLFALIGRRDRAKIKRYWNDHSGPVRSAVERLSEQDGLPTPKVDFDFVLSVSKDAFVEIRYAYERGIKPNTGWLGDTIIEEARQAILDKHPDWENKRQTSPLPDISFPF
jgi:hypothetical protein